MGWVILSDDRKLLDLCRKAIKGEAWLSDSDRTIEEIEKHYPRYREVLNDIKELTLKMESQGEKMGKEYFDKVVKE